VLEIVRKCNGNSYLCRAFCVYPPLKLSKKCQPIGAARSPWQGDGLTISRRFCGEVTS
jgi:hypothetical protein